MIACLGTTHRFRQPPGTRGARRDVQGQALLLLLCSEEAENQFLTNPRKSVLGDGFQARGDAAQSDETVLQPNSTVP